MKKKKILILIIYLISINLYANTIKNINVKSYILVDYKSNKILLEKNSNKKLYPASLNKIMTSYILADFIKKKIINKNDLVKIKKNSYWKNPYFKGSSLMFLKKNQKVKISDLNKGMIIQSGNDACVAIAEYLSGNEKNFVKLMNKYKKKINLKNTNFVNSHGLDNNKQYTTAYDMAKLSILLIKNFPKIYKIYKKKKFTFNNIKQINRNLLLWNKNLYIDGIKTGHTEKSKYNLISSSKKNNNRLIVVILGAKSIKDRNYYAKKILRWGFKNFITKKIIKKNKKIINKKIWFGKKKFLPILINKNIYINYKKEKKIKIKLLIKFTNILKAPILKNQILGNIFIKINNKIKKKYKILSLKTIKRNNIIKIILDNIKIKIYKIINKSINFLKNIKYENI